MSDNEEKIITDTEDTQENSDEEVKNDTEKAISNLKEASDTKPITESNNKFNNDVSDLIQKKKDEEKEEQQFLEKIGELCKDKTNKISDIRAELESIQNPVILGKARELVKKFENDVQVEKNKIKSLEDKLKDITIDKFEEFEMEVENIKPYYADNKEVFEDLDTSMKKREDELEDEKIIYDVHAAIDEKAKIKPNYTITEQNKDKKAVTNIVKASLEEMYEESLKEWKTMEDSKISKSERELEKGIDNYDLSPMGVDVVYDFVKDKEPITKDSKKKNITQIDKEYNIDIYNLFKGGLLTQFYKDKVYAIGGTLEPEEEFKEYSERIEKIKQKIDDFLKVIEEQNPEKIKRIEGFGKSRRRFGSTTGKDGIKKEESAEEKKEESADDKEQESADDKEQESADDKKEESADDKKEESAEEKDEKQKFKELTNKIFGNQKDFSQKFVVFKVL